MADKDQGWRSKRAVAYAWPGGLLAVEEIRQPTFQLLRRASGQAEPMRPLDGCEQERLQLGELQLQAGISGCGLDLAGQRLEQLWGWRGEGKHEAVRGWGFGNDDVAVGAGKSERA